MLKFQIFKTLAFFDAQDLPLTLMEIKAYLRPAKLSEIEKILETELQDQISSTHGFYFLKGREELTKSRISRYRASLLRFRKCRKFLSPLRFFPYVRAVAVSGSQALLNVQASSDIDLFITTKKNRIWLTRLVVSLYFQILGQRRHGDKTANRFCLNHYLGEGLTITQDRNLYTAVEYASLIPIVGHEVLEKFWRENGWIGEYMKGGGYGGLNAFTTLPKNITETFKFPLQKLFEFLFGIVFIAPLFNFLSGLYQKRRIRMEEHILISDSELSFHPGSRGQKVLQRFEKRLLTKGFFEL